MKKTIIFLIVILSAVNAYSQSNLTPIDPNNRRLGLHLAAGALIGSGVTFISYTSKNYTPTKALLISAGVSTVIGISKEVYDRSKGSQPDPYDVLATTAGGIVGSLITNKINKLIFKKKLR